MSVRNPPVAPPILNATKALAEQAKSGNWIDPATFKAITRPTVSFKEMELVQGSFDKLVQQGNQLNSQYQAVSAQRTQNLQQISALQNVVPQTPALRAQVQELLAKDPPLAAQEAQLNQQMNALQPGVQLLNKLVQQVSFEFMQETPAQQNPQPKR